MSQGPNRRDILKTGAAAGAGAVLATTPAMEAALAKLEKDASQTVPRVVLGKTGKKVPILLFGAAVDLDPRFDAKMAEAYRYGVDYIDAASVYGGGKCEPAVGNFHTRAKLRDKLWITTKSPKHDVKGFERTVDKSLKQLKTDYIDLYFLHALRDDKYLGSDMAKLGEKLKKEGKIRHIGFSCHHGNVAELMEKAATLDWIDVIMFRYNFRQYGDKELNKAMDACAKANIGLIAMKTQGSEVSFRKKWKKFSKGGKFSKHQAVLKAVWEDDRIHAVVSHMDTLGKLRENVAAALNKKQLGQVDRDALRRYASETRSLACDGCDHICGARVDAPVQIGDTLRYLMYHDTYGERDKARRLFRELPTAARQIAGVDFAGANAACPNGVDVAAHMKRALKVLA